VRVMNRSKYYQAGTVEFLHIKECGYASRITDLEAPIEGSDAVNKDYVDNQIFDRVEVNSSTYTLTSSDDLIAVLYTLTGGVTLTLPEISSVGQKQYTIVDEGGNAFVNNIDINSSGSDLIIGVGGVTISQNYNSLTLYNNGTDQWFIR